MKKLATLIAGLGLLIAAGVSHTQSTGSQGPPQYSKDCAHTPQYGKAVVCFDTTLRNWFTWNSSTQAFEAIPTGGFSTAGTGLTGSGATVSLTTPVTVANGGTQCGAPVVFASLPATPVQGAICTVTDASACTAGTPVTVGGASTVCQVVWNGTNWVPAGGANSAASGGFSAAGTGLTGAGSTVSLTVPVTVANGGTNATTAAAARASLSAAVLGVNSDITQLTGLTTPLTIGQGGTGTNYGSTGVRIQLTNAVAGTTTNDLYTTNSSGQAVNITAGTASGALGICDSGCSTSGTGTFYTGPGNHTCNFDGSVTRGDFVNISASTNGDCTDVGASQIPGFQTIGFVNQATASGAGAYTVYFYGPGVLGAGLPAAGAACNLLTDNGATWISLTPAGDLICGASLGQFKIAGIDSIAFTGTHVSGSTTNGFWCTNGSGNYVACAAATDPATTPGDMLALSSAATPNVYARVPAGALGTVLSGMGATSTPANQVNEAPVFINYNIDGTISNSTNRWRACPATLRYAPGLVAYSSASPFAFLPASSAIAGTAPTGAGVVDTYAIQDAGTTIIDVYNPASGSPTFGTPGCSPSFDGTQGGAAFARGAGPSTTVNTPSGAQSTDAGIVVCSTLSTAGSWTPPAGTTLVTGGAFSGTGISTSVFEINPIGSTTSETCTYSVTATSGAAFYTVKGAPASGEIVDVIGATRVASNTTVTWPSVTTAHNGDFMMYILASGISAGTLSAPSNPLVLGQTSNGQGVATMYGGTAGAMAAQTGTSTSGTQYDVSLGILTGSTTCTLCTVGDKTEMIGPTTGTNGADLSVSIGGAK